MTSIRIATPSAPSPRPAASATVHLTAATFDREVLQSKDPVMVDFWSPLCAPCRAMGPKVDKLADALNSKMKIAKYQLDPNRPEDLDTMKKYDTMAIPAFLVFQNGQVVARKVGGMSDSELADFVKPYHD